jgi:ribonuclease HII
MIIPDFSREADLQKKGYLNIAGVDEAGRGPWAGPVVAGAVIFENNEKLIAELIAAGIRDSKKISEKKREKLYDFIIQNSRAWGVGIVSEKIIDEINILNATKLAMKLALEKMSVRPDLLLIDGNGTLQDFPARQLAVPRADQTILSVSAASILAKVTRDRMLIQFEEKYPGYGFSKHKGYGTQMHMDALINLGPCEIHRRSFAPIKRLL